MVAFVRSGRDWKHLRWPASGSDSGAGWTAGVKEMVFAETRRRLKTQCRLTSKWSRRVIRLVPSCRRDARLIWRVRPLGMGGVRMMDSIPTEFVVRRISEVRRSPMGHPYVEAEVDGGTIAFWGSASNMSNIEDVRRYATPFRIICECIRSNWDQHDRWVHERHEIIVVEPLEHTSRLQPTEVQAGPATPARSGRTVVLSCRRCGHRRELSGPELRALAEAHGIPASRSIPAHELERLRCERCGVRDVRQWVRSEYGDTHGPSRLEVCSACGGNGGAAQDCWRCRGRGLFDASREE